MAVQSAAVAATIYVKPTGSDYKNGLSWANARKTVTGGLFAAASGDQVWVAAGTYVESVTLRTGVALYGGFAGTETQLEQRDWVVNVTILDGNQGGRVVTAPSGATASTRIDGFTIRNGYANGGGGIFCSSSSPTICNNTITGNTVNMGCGGGISCLSASSPIITGNTIAGNSVRTNAVGLHPGGGGGVYCESSSPSISDNLIRDNIADVGGGITCRSCSPVISGNRIAGNTAIGGGSAVFDGCGGGIHCDSSSPTIRDNVILGNVALVSGGGICSDNVSSPTISNNAISGNGTGPSAGTPGYGWAGNGGGIFCCSASTVITNNVLTANGAGAGGGIYCDAGYPSISNNTIVRNSAEAGGGIFCHSAAPAISNNIVAFNSSGIARWRRYDDNGLRNNCVYNPDGYDYSLIDPGVGDISVDPELVAAGYGQVHLAVGSPCIDTGVDEVVQAGWVDMDGEVRTQGEHVDIGADEFNGTPPPPFMPAVVRVSPSGNDANDGSSWVLAKRTVQGGIDAASNVGGEVWVAAGVYAERIVLRPWAFVYGGFAGTEDGREERNWRIQASTLDGGAGGSVVRISGGYRANRIDGFTIRNGTGTPMSAGSQFLYGGGIFCIGSAPTISNNTIAGNNGGEGGGIYCVSAMPAIVNNTITGNSAGVGGGISCASSSAAILNNRITGNGANSGGGIACSSTWTSTILNNTIVGNAAGDSGGGIHCRHSTPIVSNNIVAFNSSGISRDTGYPETPTLNSNCVYNPGGMNYSSVEPGVGDIWVDPQLADPGHGEVHLTAGSPCIDAGEDGVVQSDWSDIDGEARIQGVHVDIGADEFNGATHSFVPSIVRVSPSGNDANDGSSWALAKKTVQGGIDAASRLSGEVWVSAGVYNERISLRSWAYVYGGFAGTESSRDQRNWATHATILDGGAGGTVVRVTMGHGVSGVDGFTIRNGSGDYGGGVSCKYASARIVNNRIVGNYASASGGGVYCYQSSSLLANNTIWGNGAGDGGGIACVKSSWTIVNNTIVGNDAGALGGGIYCGSTSGAMSNNVVAFNSSGIFVTAASGTTPIMSKNCVHNPGGADYSGVDPGTGDVSSDPRMLAVGYGEVHLTAGSPCIDTGEDGSVQAGLLDMDGEARIQGDHVDIGADEFNGTAPSFMSSVVRVSPSGNDANDGSNWLLAKRTVQGGIDAASATGGEVWVGAGVYNERITLKPRAYIYGGFAGTETMLDQRNWTAHASILDGGADGSVVRVVSGHFVSGIDGFTIRNGLNAQGGGLCITSASPIIANNRITGNSALRDGGGLYCSRSGALLWNNTISGNVTCSYYDPGRGGGLSCVDSSLIVSNNTIIGNEADGLGGGIYCESSPAAISNNIVAFNSSGICSGQGAAPALQSNCVHNPGGDDYTGVNPGDGDLSADPLLIAADFGEMHLGSGSPCIDAGSDSAAQVGLLDIDGEPRVQGVHADIGADEFAGSPPPPFAPRIIRVRPAGNDVNNGSTWGTAKRTVQSAIDAAGSSGSGEVWVAKGTYNERISLKPWVHVYGGFAGTESDRDQRSWASNPTILDGSVGGSVVTAISGGNTGRIDGFTIRNGAGTSLYGIGTSLSYVLGGGGIYCNGSSPAIVNNTITRNVVNGVGGGIYCGNSMAVIQNCTIAGNKGSRYGGGVYMSFAKPTVIGCTFSGNNGSYGAGVYSTYSPASLSNCILWGNPSRAITVEYGPSPILSYCDVQGGYAGTGNIDSDPRFVRNTSPGADGFWGTADDDCGDLRLLAGSPCIDAGSNAAAAEAGILTDLDGFPRFVNDPATDDCTVAPGTCGTGPIVDMGAYEFIPGDYDRDGDVDLDDLGGLQECASGPAVAYAGDCLKADFDRDGDVDQEDFGVFQRCFGGAGKAVGPGCG